MRYAKRIDSNHGETMTTEEWRPVRDATGYEVSSLGRVRSLDRLVECYPYGLQFRRGRVLKENVSKSGYADVQCGLVRRALVHRLVAEAFCPGEASRLEVNHLNGKKLDNRAANLEWCTSSENSKHAYRELGMVPGGVGKFGAASSRAKAVRAVDPATGLEVGRWDGVREACRLGPYNHTGISLSCSGKAKTHAGLVWSYV